MNRRETILGMLMTPFATLFAGKAKAAEVTTGGIQYPLDLSGKTPRLTQGETLLWNESKWPAMPAPKLTLYPPVEPGHVRMFDGHWEIEINGQKFEVPLKVPVMVVKP